jgi:hypothetical protein
VLLEVRLGRALLERDQRDREVAGQSLQVGDDLRPPEWLRRPVIGDVDD